MSHWASIIALPEENTYTHAWLSYVKVLKGLKTVILWSNDREGWKSELITDVSRWLKLYDWISGLLFLGEFRAWKKPPNKSRILWWVQFLLVIKQLTTLVSDVPFLEVFLETSCAVYPPCSVVLLRVRLQAAAKLITHMSIMFIHTPSPSQHPLQSLPSVNTAARLLRSPCPLFVTYICPPSVATPSLLLVLNHSQEEEYCKITSWCFAQVWTDESLQESPFRLFLSFFCIFFNLCE